MIVTRPIAIRIALILILTVVLQVSFFSFLSILGVAPNVLPVVIVSLGLIGGGVVGAVCGFAAGFLLDSVLLQTLGVSSLVLLSIGYLAGRYREGATITNRYVPALLAGVLTLVGAFGFAAIELMLGVDATVSLLVIREIVVQGLLAFLLAFGIYPLIRLLLRAGLVDYTPPARRSPLGIRRRRRGSGHSGTGRVRTASGSSRGPGSAVGGGLR